MSESVPTTSCDHCDDKHCAICGGPMGMVDHEPKLCRRRRVQIEVQIVLKKLYYGKMADAQEILGRVAADNRLAEFDAELERRLK